MKFVSFQFTVFRIFQTSFAIVAAFGLMAGAALADKIVVSDAKTGEKLAEIELGGEVKIGDRLIKIEKKEQTATEKKARAIEIPMIDFDSAWIGEGIDFLRQRTKELDTFEFDPSRKGLNIRCLNKEVARKEVAELKLRNASVYHVLEAMAQQAGLEVEYGEESILLKPAKK